jgi:hypothetical protein
MIFHHHPNLKYAGAACEVDVTRLARSSKVDVTTHGD